jgi:hypothetical protein
MNLDQDTRWNCTWDEFEKLFSNKWLKDTKMEKMLKIQDELKEGKEEIKNKGDELSKIRLLNEALVKEVKKIKQEKLGKESGKK